MYSDKDVALIIDLLKNKDISGWFKNNEGGPYLQEFQGKFAEFCGTRYAFAVSSGSSSIYIGLRACGIGHGDYVAVPAYTHVGSVAPIVLAGAKPVFVDVDDYGNIDAQDLKRVAKRRKLRAVVVVHMLGMPCEMDSIKEAISPATFIVEDASHALGAEYRGARTGSLGSVGCFSIGGGRTKTIGTGEGGMITVNDEELAARCKNIRNHGDRMTDVPYLCFNFRMSELNALVGLVQMDRLGFFIDWQMDNAKYLIRNLPDCLEVLSPPSHVKTVFYLVGCLWRCLGMTREKFLTEVRERGFEGGIPRKNIGPGWSKLIYDMQYYRMYRKRCPNSELLRDKAVWFDWHRYPRTKEEIDEMLEAIKDILHAR